VVQKGPPDTTSESDGTNDTKTTREDQLAGSSKDDQGDDQGDGDGEVGGAGDADVDGDAPGAEEEGCPGLRETTPCPDTAAAADGRGSGSGEEVAQ